MQSFGICKLQWFAVVKQNANMIYAQIWHTLHSLKNAMSCLNYILRGSEDHNIPPKDNL